MNWGSKKTGMGIVYLNYCFYAYVVCKIFTIIICHDIICICVGGKTQTLEQLWTNISQELWPTSLWFPNLTFRFFKVVAQPHIGL